MLAPRRSPPLFKTSPLPMMFHPQTLVAPAPKNYYCQNHQRERVELSCFRPRENSMMKTKKDKAFYKHLKINK